ncbi:DUF3857 domain-containing protein [Pedobacter gandavensis]|uniref:DUF3857 domain-containing protein n=1 Tax=Pedobacter gandavensis TaxID=2679963 RepID=UPI002930B68A|nr:DUF3857 domain-containing protein [Pedobacter gandavensis]
MNSTLEKKKDLYCGTKLTFMHTLKSLLCGLFLLTVSSTFAQTTGTEAKNFKYGKINLNEFEVKPGGVDSAAAAVALFDICRGWFEISSKTNDFVFVYERHTRYKVINKTAYDLANLEIQLYNNKGNESTLSQLEAATYHLENGKIIPFKINKDGKFSEKQDKNYTLKKFTLPNVKEGAIIEYKYRVTSDFKFKLKTWYFQKSIPVLYSSYSVTIPEYFDYKTTAQGFIFLNPKAERSQKTYTLGTSHYDALAITHNYTAENVPALKSEPFITTLQDYISKIDFELSSTQYPNQMRTNYTSTWPKIITTIKEEEKFGLFADKRSSQKTLVQQLIKGETNQDSIVNILFNYVKNSVKWNGENSLYADATNPKSVLEKKTGNSADINLSLYALLKAADIPAFPVLLSTRDNGAHSGLPMLSQFDNVIVAVLSGEKYLFLDAVDKNHIPGLIAFDNLSHEGFKIDMETLTGEWIPLEQLNISRKQITYSLILGEENKMSGKRYSSYSFYEGLNFRDDYQKALNEAAYLKDYKSNKPGLSIKNYVVSNLNDQKEAITETMDVEIEDHIEEAGNLLYFTPLLYDKTTENPFKLEDRKFPVDFGFPTEEVYRFNLEFPAGYQLDKLPKSEKISLEDQSASFTFLTAAQDNTLQITSKIVIKKAVYTPEEYKGLQDFFKNIVRKQAEQIVLKKI